MDTEVIKVTNLARKFDKDFFAKRTRDGVIRVMHRVPRWNGYDVDGVTIVCNEPQEYLVFSLTEDFSSGSRQASWGELPLRQKFLEISFDRRDEMLKEMEENNRKADEAKDRQISNACEDVAREMRSDFQKTFSDTIATGGEDSRRKYDRRAKWLS